MEDLVALRRHTTAVTQLRALARAGARPRGQDAQTSAVERCDLCHAVIPGDHRHLLALVERRIVCACEACWALRSGDPEYRPTGMRTLWLESFRCDPVIWASLQIPIGLAFFMRSSISDAVVAFYPSPAGATESELTITAWDELVGANPILRGLEPDAEALVVNRLAQPTEHVIAPIDDCYALVGLIKSRWEGISGGSALQTAVPQFFEAMRRRAKVIR